MSRGMENWWKSIAEYLRRLNPQETVSLVFRFVSGSSTDGDVISNLPCVPAELIFSYLTAQDLLEGCRVSTSWYRAISTSIAWLALYHRIPIVRREPYNSDVDWKNAYIRGKYLMDTLASKSAFQTEQKELKDFEQKLCGDLTCVDYDDSHLLVASRLGYVWLLFNDGGVVIEKANWRVRESCIVKQAKICVGRGLIFLGLQNGFIKMYNFQGILEYETWCHNGPVLSIVFCQNCDLLISGSTCILSRYACFKVWKLCDGKIELQITVNVLQGLPEPPLQCSLHVQCKSHRLVCVAHKTMEIWKLTEANGCVTGSFLKQFSIYRCKGSVTGYSDNGREVCIARSQLHFVIRDLHGNLDGPPEAVLISCKPIKRMLGFGKHIALAVGEFDPYQHSRRSNSVNPVIISCKVAEDTFILGNGGWLDGFSLTEICAQWKKQILLVSLLDNSVNIVWMTAPVALKG